MFMDVSLHIYNFRAKLQLQVVQTQWLLIVELHQFCNPYNAMLSGFGFCCCDDSMPGVHCADEASAILPPCKPSCDIWLNVSVSHCTEPSPCSFSTSVIHLDSSPASTYNFSEKFVFVLSTGISPADEVRVAKDLCNHHQCIYIYIVISIMHICFTSPVIVMYCCIVLYC